MSVLTEDVKGVEVYQWMSSFREMKTFLCIYEGIGVVKPEYFYLKMNKDYIHQHVYLGILREIGIGIKKYGFNLALGAFSMVVGFGWSLLDNL